MKKIIITLVIIMAMMLTGNQNTFAQIEVIVEWNPQCGDTCTTQQVCAYVIGYNMYDICQHPYELICSGSDTVGCSSNDVSFRCNYHCDEPTSEEKCFLFSATAVKYCIGPPNGYLVTCSGDGYILKSCSELDDPVPITIIWD